MSTNLTVVEPRTHERWLVGVALGLGGVLFVARYLVLGLLYAKSLVDGSISFVDVVGMWYLLPLSFAFSYPAVFWCATGLCLMLWWRHCYGRVRVRLRVRYCCWSGW